MIFETDTALTQLFGRRELRNVGRELRRLREEGQFSQARLGELAGLSTGAVRELEGGHTNPALGTIVAIVEALGTTIDALVEAARTRVDPFEVSRADECAKGRQSRLTRALPDPSMEGVILTLNGEDSQTFGGSTAFVHVLTGTVAARIDGDAYSLGPGDSFHVCADAGGAMVGGPEGAQVLLVTSRDRILSESPLQDHNRGHA